MGEPFVEGANGCVLLDGGDLLAKQREQLQRFGLAQDQGFADDRVAADGEPRQQRVRVVAEVDAEERGEEATQPEALDQDDLATGHAAVACNIERQLQPAPGAVQARQRRRGGEPATAPFRGQSRIEGDADPAGEPVQMLLRSARRISQQVRGGHAILERRQHRLEAGEEAVEEVGGGRSRPVERDRVRSLRSGQARPSRVLQQPCFARLIDADRRGRAEPQAGVDEAFCQRAGRCAAGIEPRRESDVELVDRFAGSKRGRAVQRLAIELRQVLVAIREAAAPAAQGGNFRTDAAVAEQFDAHPQIASHEGPHAPPRILYQRREQAGAIRLARPRPEAGMSGQLRWPSLPCGVRLLQRSGARNVAAEAMRAPRRVIGRRCGLGGHGEPHDETRAGRNRRLGIEAMPHGHLAAAVEQVRLPVSEVLRIAVARGFAIESACSGAEPSPVG